jgi:lysine N-acyltransferase
MTDIDEVLKPILPRELTSFSHAVRAVGAPPTPTLAEPYDIRLADPDSDAELVSEWMNRPHLVAVSS